MTTITSHQNNRHNLIVLFLLVTIIILFGLLTSCRAVKEFHTDVKKDSIVYKDSIRFVEKIIKIPGQIIEVPVDCSKKDSFLFIIGNLQAKLFTNNGKAELKLVSKEISDTSINSQSFSQDSKTHSEIKQSTQIIEKKVYPFWFVWVIMTISLICNSWFIFRSINQKLKL